MRWQAPGRLWRRRVGADAGALRSLPAQAGPALLVTPVYVPPTPARAPPLALAEAHAAIAASTSGWWPGPRRGHASSRPVARLRRRTARFARSAAPARALGVPPRGNGGRSLAAHLLLPGASAGSCASRRAFVAYG